MRQDSKGCFRKINPRGVRTEGKRETGGRERLEEELEVRALLK